MLFGTVSYFLAVLPGVATITDGRPVPDAIKADAPPIKWFVKMGSHTEVPLENPHFVYDIGKQLPLFQQNGEIYVAIVTSYDGTMRLCSFPRYVGNESSAWISKENLLIFGHRTECCDGTFLFDRDEILPLVSENEESYTIAVERNGRKMLLSVSKKAPGVILVPQAQNSRVIPAGQVMEPSHTAITQPAISLDTSSLSFFVERPAPAFAEPSQELTLAKIKEEVLQEIMDKWEEARKSHVLSSPLEAVNSTHDAQQEKVVHEEPLRDKNLSHAVNQEIMEAVQAAIRTTTHNTQTPAALPPSPTAAEPAQLVNPQQESSSHALAQRQTWPQEPAGNSYWKSLLISYIHDNAVTLVLAGIMLPLGLFIAARWHPKKSTMQATSQAAPRFEPNSAPTTTEVLTYSTVGESVTPDSTSTRMDDRGDLSGTLGGHILPQVVEFFCSAHESGRMVVRQDNGLTEELIFNGGQIVDAKSGNLRGTDAARMILQQREGSFVFHRSNQSSVKLNIEQKTMALLLDSHRHSDEMRASVRA